MSPRKEPPPWVAGRAEFYGVFADLAKARRNWQLLAFGLFGLLAFVTVAYARLASEARITPYVVEVDRLGRAVAIGPAERIGKTDPRVVEATLSTFVRDLRTVFADPEAQKEFLYRAYAHVSGSAKTALDDHFSDPDHDPRLIGQRATRRVEDVDLLKLPGSSHTWKVRWTEVETPRFLGPPQRSAWEAFFTVNVDPPKTAEVVRFNPLGIYVTAASWARIASAPVKGAS